MSEDSNDFHIQVVTTKDRVTRILISERVLNELPIIEPMLERLVATDYVEWPESFVITHHDEPLPPKSNHPIVVLPPWIFERVNTDLSKPREVFQRIAGKRLIDQVAYSFAWLFVGHFKSADDLEPTVAAISGKIDVFMNKNGSRVSYRRVARLFGAIILFLPVMLFLAIRAYGMAKLMPMNHDALFRLADIQLGFAMRNGLRRTQRKLIAAGASPEDVRKYDFPPDLQIVDNNEQELE